MVRALALLAFCLMPIVASAQRSETARRLDGLPAVVDSIFRRDREDMPGCVVGVARPGLPALVRAYGAADLENGIANTPESIFETGSLAKQFTASAVVLLAQDGKLLLDDDVRRFLPELPDFGQRITLRQMLTHTSGLREQWSLLAIAGSPPGSQVHEMSTILDLVSRQRALNFAPGAEFLYTNTNYSLLAMVVERVSGRTMQQFMEERLFQPLGMTHTRWREDFRQIVPGRARAYSPSGPREYRENMPFTNVYGNGGLLTTVGDLLRWSAFLDDPRSIPGGTALVDTLQKPGRLSNGRPLGYAFGLEVGAMGHTPVVSHSGSTAGYKTWLGRVPGKGLSVALLCNDGGVDPAEVGTRLFARALEMSGLPVLTGEIPPAIAPSGDMRPAPVGPPDTAITTLAQYAGTYRSPELDVRITIVVDGGKLVMRQPFGIERPLTALFAGGFTTPLRGTTTVVFSRSSSGRVDGLGVWAGGARDVRFVRE